MIHGYQQQRRNTRKYIAEPNVYTLIAVFNFQFRSCVKCKSNASYLIIRSMVVISFKMSLKRKKRNHFRTFADAFPTCNVPFISARRWRGNVCAEHWYVNLISFFQGTPVPFAGWTAGAFGGWRSSLQIASSIKLWWHSWKGPCYFHPSWLVPRLQLVSRRSTRLGGCSSRWLRRPPRILILIHLLNWLRVTGYSI